VVDRFNRVSKGPINAEYCIVISDLWGAEGVTLQPTDPYPGDDGDWSAYEDFIRLVMADAAAAGMKPHQVQYEVWNEPDFTSVYWPRPKAQYEEMWRRGVRLIRTLEPKARITGPTFTRLATTGSSWHMDHFLDMAAASGTAPDILSWHDLIPGRDPVDQAGVARRLLTERGLAGVKLEINEYPASDALDPGYNSWYVARLQRAKIDYGVLAIYGPCCMFPQLDGLLTQDGDHLYRTGRWWAYERYASLSGSLVAAQPTTLLDGIASTDPSAGRARVLIGNRRGDGTPLGTVDVVFRGLQGRGYLQSGGRVHVRTERIADRDRLESPEVVKDLQLTVDGDQLTVPLDWQDSASAYVVTLGRQETQLPDYVVIGSDPTDVVLLPNEPTTIRVTTRSYSETARTVPVTLAVPPGYTATGPSSMTIPANGDATFEVQVTRTSASLDSAEMTVTVGNQSLRVDLTASDNWGRIAAFSASSTHPPSSPANLGDGRTDSAIWGGGGAGGWNDDTAGAFPDTVTATWPHEISLSRVRVFTLDSAQYPASAWGVRDYDLLATVAGAEVTLAQVRGNVSGVVDTPFSSVTTSRLQVRILDSNSHDYSRLIEVEAYS
jgi:hypothetical protein